MAIFTHLIFHFAQLLHNHLHPLWIDDATLGQKALQKEVNDEEEASKF